MTTTKIPKGGNPKNCWETAVATIEGGPTALPVSVWNRITRDSKVARGEDKALVIGRMLEAFERLKQDNAAQVKALGGVRGSPKTEEGRLPPGAQRLQKDSRAPEILVALKKRFKGRELPKSAQVLALPLGKFVKLDIASDYTVGDALSAGMLQARPGNQMAPVESLPGAFNAPAPVEARKPVKGKGGKNETMAAVKEGGLSARITSEGGIVSLREAKRQNGPDWKPNGNWDGARDLNTKMPSIWGTGENSTNRYPDQVAESVGMDVNEMWTALHDEADSKKKIAEDDYRDPREAEGDKMDAQMKRFRVDTSKRSKEHPLALQPSMLSLRDMVEVDGEKMTVVAIDEDGTVTLQDGDKYGVGVVEAGETIWVQKTEPASERRKTAQEFIQYFKANPELDYARAGKKWGLSEVEIANGRQLAEKIKRDAAANRKPDESPGTDFTLAAEDSMQQRSDRWFNTRTINKKKRLFPSYELARLYDLGEGPDSLEDWDKRADDLGVDLKTFWKLAGEYRKRVLAGGDLNQNELLDAARKQTEENHGTDFTLESPEADQIKAEAAKAKDKAKIQEKQDKPLTGNAGDMTPDMLDPNADDAPLFMQGKPVETPDAKFASDLELYGTAKFNGDTYTIKQSYDGKYYLERTRDGIRETIASGFDDIPAANELSIPSIIRNVQEGAATGQQVAPDNVPGTSTGKDSAANKEGYDSQVSGARPGNGGERGVFGYTLESILDKQQGRGSLRPAGLREQDKQQEFTEQSKPDKKPVKTEQSSKLGPQKPALTPAQERLKAMAERLRSAKDGPLQAQSLAPSYETTIPRQENAELLSIGEGLFYDDGVKTPEALAKMLSDMDLRQYSSNLWSAMLATGGIKDKSAPDWDAIYRGLDAASVETADGGKPAEVEPSGLISPEESARLDDVTRSNQVRIAKATENQIAQTIIEAGSRPSSFKKGELFTKVHPDDLRAALDAAKVMGYTAFDKEEPATLPAPGTEGFKALPKEQKLEAVKSAVAKKRLAKPKTVQAIVDVGEKIGGSRKDRWKERGLALSDYDGLSDTEKQAYTAKPQVFPKPDYQALIDGGTPKVIAYAIKEVYDSISPKPTLTRDQQADPVKREAALRSYVEAVGRLRDGLKDVKTREGILALREQMFPQEGSGYSRQYTPMAKSLMHLVSTGARRDELHGAMGLSEYDLHKLTRKLEKLPDWPAPQEQWQRMFDVRQVPVGSFSSKRLPDGTWEEVTTTADSPPVWEVTKGRQILSEHSSKEAAEAWAKQAATKARKEDPKRPLNKDAKRVGPDYRHGRNITGDELLKEFGFRGAEFGNWTNEADRQQSLNQAFDGLHDLAAVLHIPPQAISLNGELGIAFGARGSGKAAAHYEPAKVAINLTRTSGAGALAHEWGHALDDYFGRMATGGQSAKYVSEGSKGGDFRAELGDTINAVMKAISERQWTQPEYLQSLRDMNSGAQKSVDSWLKSVERAIDKVKLAPEQKDAVDMAFMQLRGQKMPPATETGRPDMTKVAVQMLHTIAAAAKEQKIRIDWPVTGGGKINDLAAGLGRHSGMIFATNNDLARAEAGHIDMPNRTVKTDLLTASVEQGEYWSRKRELFSRTFEAFVQDSIAASGNESPYLVQGTSGTGGWGNLYPQGDERAATNAAFQKMVEVMKSKETERGTALQAQSMDGGEDMDADSAMLQGMGRSYQEERNIPEVRAMMREAWEQSNRKGSAPDYDNKDEVEDAHEDGETLLRESDWSLPGGYNFKLTYDSYAENMAATAAWEIYHDNGHSISGDGILKSADLQKKAFDLWLGLDETAEKIKEVAEAHNHEEFRKIIKMMASNPPALPAESLFSAVEIGSGKGSRQSKSTYTTVVFTAKERLPGFEDEMQEHKEEDADENPVWRYSADVRVSDHQPGFSAVSTPDIDLRVGGARDHGNLRHRQGLGFDLPTQEYGSWEAAASNIIREAQVFFGDKALVDPYQKSAPTEIASDGGRVDQNPSTDPLAGDGSGGNQSVGLENESTGGAGGQESFSLAPAADAEYLAAAESGDLETAQKMVDAAAEAAGYNAGPVWHHGGFNAAENPVPVVGEEGMHFGTEDAARQRAYGKLVDDFIKEAEVTYDEDLGAWLWSSQGVDSFDVVEEDGFSSRDDAQESLESFASEQGENEGSDAIELGTFTTAFLRSGDAVKVDDQKDSWVKAVKSAKAKGVDSISYKNLYEDKGSTSYIVFNPNQIKSADPITYDSEGKIIPLSKRFNPASDSILYAQSFERLLADAGVDTDDLDQLADEAAQEQSGERTIGSPQRALGGGVGQTGESTPGDPVIFGTDHYYDERRQKQTNEEQREKARALLEEDYDGTVRHLVEYGLSGGAQFFGVTENMQLQMILEAESRLPLTDERKRLMQALRMVNLMTGTAQGQNLQSRVDVFKTPIERAREHMAEAIFDPSPPVARRMKKATDPKEMEKLLEIAAMETEKLRKMFAKMGFTLEEILNGDKVLGLVNHAAAVAAVNTLSGKAREAVRMVQAQEKPKAQIIKETGLSEKEIREAAKAARAAFIADGLRRAALAAKEAVLQAQAMQNETVIDYAAMAQMSPEDQVRYMESLADMAGLVADDQLFKREAKKRKKVKLFVPPATAGHRDKRREQSQLPLGPPDRNAPRVPAVGTGRGTGAPVEVKTPGMDRNDPVADLLGKLWVDPAAQTSVRIGADMADPDDVIRLIRAAQAAKASGFDMFKEAGIMNLLSGMSTQVANVLGNTGTGVIDFGPTRGMEVLLNLVFRNQDSAQVGELKYMLKAMLPGIKMGGKRALRAWRTEKGWFENDVGNPQEELFEVGGKVGMKAAISETPFEQMMSKLKLPIPHAMRKAMKKDPALERWAVSAGASLDTMMDFLLNFKKLKLNLNPARGRAARFPSRGLLAMDDLFKSLWGQMEAASQAYRIALGEIKSGKVNRNREWGPEAIAAYEALKGKYKGTALRDAMGEHFQQRMNYLVSKPNSEAWQRAIKKAQEMAFQQDLPEVVRKLTELLGSLPLLGWMKSLFMKTGYNILRTGVRKSPVGSVNLAWQTLKHGLVKVTNYQLEPSGAPDMIHYLAEQVLVWGFGLSAMALRMGAGDDDDAKKEWLLNGSPKGLPNSPKELLAKKAGEEGLTFRTPMGTLNYGRVEPLAGILSSVADLMEAANTGQLKGKPMKVITELLMNQVGNKPVLRGPSDIIKGIKDPEKMATTTKKTLLNMMVPAFFRQMARSADETVRDNSSAEWYYSTWPSAENAGNPLLDPTSGEELKKGGSTASRLLTPPAAARGELSEAEKTVVLWNKHNPEKAWAPAPPNNVLTYKEKHGDTPSVKVELNPKAYDYVQKRAALFARQALGSRKWAADEKSFHEIKNIYDAAERRAADELRKWPVDRIGTVK